VKLSVVIPVHDRARLTGRCLEAVLADERRPEELIVVDDASTDSTADLLASYGEAIRTVRLERNEGFAAACNRGAALADGEAIVFLNNDTEPRPGWLAALSTYAEEHPAAAVVGARLLYPTGAVQHAGVAIGQDGYPHNLYAGFPADHPAVAHSRRLQAVTGACMLVRRETFEAAGGFDTGFLNSLEDVDLCLRIGEAGGEVHYCAAAIVTHLESVSRGRRDRFERSLALYRERWRQRVRRDDLALYAEDGLIGTEYAASYPLRLEIAPELAIVADRERPLERLLETYAGQVAELSAEVVRLTVALGSRTEAVGAEGHPQPGNGIAGTDERLDHDAFLREAARLEAGVAALQRRLEAAGAPTPAGDDFTASHSLGYRLIVEQLREAVTEAVPAGARVLIVSRGDRELVELEGLDCQHFPQDEAGRYAGFHPRDGAEAVAQLESLREDGAEYLVFPATAYWWLEHYGELAERLDRFERTDSEVCAVFCLAASAAETESRAGAVGDER
jgi:GT2 family glycosyltransferase